jgi:hypothetical protein
MLSSARVYVFGINYKNSDWLCELQANQLAGTICQLFTDGIPYFTFKNLNFINVYNTTSINKKYGCELHIEKIMYKENKILSKEYIMDLRGRLRGQLRKVSLLKFGNILVVNDEYDFTATSGYLLDEQLIESNDYE